MKNSSQSTRGMKTAFFVSVNLLQAAHSFSVQGPQSNRNGISTKSGGYNQILMNPLEEERSRHFSSFSLHLSSSNVDYAQAEDVKSIKSLFSKYADESDSMTKDTLCKVPPFDEMLEVEDLSMEELTEIWDKAPKSGGDESRIGADSFVQIYQAVDDLFEDDEKEADVVEEAKAPENVELNAAQSELKVAFNSLCDDNKLISKVALKAWDEIETLFAENLLGQSEFDDIWSKTAASSEQLDLAGFLSFNAGLDDLFEYDDEEGDESGTVQTNEPTLPVTKKMVQGDDLPPAVLFAAIADENYLVGMNELKLWAELQEMLEEEDLLPSELQDFYDSIEDKKSGKLSEEGFVTLYEKIDVLFEDDDEEEANDDAAAAAQASRIKEDLLGFVNLIDNDDDEEALACCLDSTEKDQKQVMNIVSALEAQPTNFIKQKKGNIDSSDLTGTWEMIYSSSSGMKFNKGLSGLGGSFPNGRFGGLKQKLTATKYVRDVEYQEWIKVNPSAASFYVTINGSWDLKTSMSLFTGEPSIVLNIEPDRVQWGTTVTKGDHWKSLGPTNLLDLTYLDEDFRVMRGCTSTETIFLYKRVAEEGK
ncbi:unnamed protein product [Cylindrotheca closterium]|uniref:Uncharacterized protein n=1 Tax=Cylindrotheca closterium TaxID=2856 RepID=A0AAD2CR99_9STRA|nr:unnamed protein product [Cylindrotheca closterium]